MRILLQRKLPWRMLFIAGALVWLTLTVLLLLMKDSNPKTQQNVLDTWQQPVHVLHKDSGLPQNVSQAQLLKSSPVAVLLLACNRPQAVQRSLSQLLALRPAGWEAAYPVLVSMDCANSATESVVARFANRLAGRLKQPDQRKIKTPLKERKLIGYYQISRHFKWALDQVFLRLNYSAVIVVEDDLDIAPDFYAYFHHLSPLLSTDPTIWCISAWNDNGKASLIDQSRPDLFHRTDFFPGLGWMLRRSLWLELRTKWPAAYWDDHLRKPNIRLGRACIRPEISRSYTFGREGVSHGQHFDKYLRHIVLHNSTKDVHYDRIGIQHLTKAHYDAQFLALVYGLPLAADINQALLMPLLLPSSSSNQTNSSNLSIGLLDRPSVRVEYSNRKQYETATKELGAMTDFKHGVPRCGYEGVVSVFKSGRRIFLAPKLPWSGYVTAWTN